MVIYNIYTVYMKVLKILALTALMFFLSIYSYSRVGFGPSLEPEGK